MPAQESSKESFSIIKFLWQSKSAILLIALNVIIFKMFESGRWTPELKQQLVLAPSYLMQGKFWTLITAGYLHSTMQHLLLNALGIFVFARLVEIELGFWKTLAIYHGALILSMLFAVIGYGMFMEQNIGIIGASGAVMGLVAVAMLLAPFAITWELILPIPTMFKAWAFIFADVKGFLGGEQNGVSHLAHLCGYMAIAFLVYFFSTKNRHRFATGLLINILSVIIFGYVYYEFFR